MCMKQGHRHSINCIVPPHMLQVLTMRGDKKLSQMAKTMLSQSEGVREERASMSTAPMVLETTRPNSAFVTPALACTTRTRNLTREIYDGEGKASLPGKLIRKEGDAATGDEVADIVYDASGSVYDMYFNEFSRDSLDGAGMKLKATVHHRKSYNNAFWNGEQMAYGDGDGRIFRTFAEPSVIGHEMSHGIVQFSGGLIYRGQSGALNESFADVFGSMMMQ
jgi:Zn-dependent metalloprotease